MPRKLTLWAIGACATALIGLSTIAQAAPEVTLTRLECGTLRPAADVNERFSDTWAYDGLKLPFVFSCYLVKHGDEYLLWDTGFAMNSGPTAPKTSVVDQLAQLKLTPANIKFVGISHYDADHTGQVDSFPDATLLIGAGDWDALTKPKPAPGAN